MNALTRLVHIGLEDFLLALRFPDFFTQQVGGFINIIQGASGIVARFVTQI